MSRKIRLGVIAIISILVVASFGYIGRYSLLNSNQNGYLLEKKVPGIVKGTTKMVDTKSYFTKYDLQESSLRLDFVCNNSNNLEIAIGYKSPTISLMNADNPTKEVVIWSAVNLYPENCINYKSQKEISISRITKEWDLFSIGFTTDEYIQADKRIWYLRINELNNGSYGFERNETHIINGTEYLLPEFIPNVHYIEEFKLAFNNLIFETMLYPFFDGSTEIIIPIRGVNHELAIEDSKTNVEIRGMTINSSWSTTTPAGSAGNMWAVIFGTSNYVYALSTKLDYPPMEMRCFILGSELSSAPDEFKVGIYDYGWRVAYCMDGNSTQTDIATCTQTDDGYYESMLDFADGQLGSTGKLIVHLACHGKESWGKHVTMTGTSRWFCTWLNSIKLSEHNSKVDAITSDGTHVLYFIGSCKGYELDNFHHYYHNYNLESWSFKPKCQGIYEKYSVTYQTFCWQYTWYGPWSEKVYPECNSGWLFLGAYNGTCVETITHTGLKTQYWYNEIRWNNSDITQMYIQSTWGSHYFYINWGY